MVREKSCPTMWEAELAIRHHGCPVSDVSADHPAVRLENVSRVRVSDGIAKRLLALEGDDEAIDEFACDYRDHEAAVGLERVSAADARRTYFISEIDYSADNPSILSLIDRTGCFQYSTVVVEHGIEHWMVYMQRKCKLKNLVDLLETRNNNVDLVRNVDVGPITEEHAIQHEALRSELTNKQLAAFETALKLGYYTSDEHVTVDDIASLLGVHRSTAGEHIKRAEETLLSEIGAYIFPDIADRELHPDVPSQ
ncbi:hypothetical protein GRX01_04010 [Halobaculum sp. WSA2]|uniref:HTH bat-type domain-containing protein n=1 Tax=Halobaculum saliterrae TaxID=2073113 RepID=A0A6B0SV75_9EURY|nr:helix-turn-helix domain-containing protein [Halobaculum saliterrae]MXR40513.1 hypothetical protein [Halobaculum saliterrae]